MEFAIPNVFLLSFLNYGIHLLKVRFKVNKVQRTVIAVVIMLVVFSV
jgi:hypothetical protein